jgi:hypothetical protein
MGIDPMNNILIIIRILFAVTLFQQHEDVVMRLLAMSLTEDAQRWFRGLPDNHLASYDDFAKLLNVMSRFS